MSASNNTHGSAVAENSVLLALLPPDSHRRAVAMPPFPFCRSLDFPLGGAMATAPERVRHWNAVYKRFARWAEAGVFEQLHQFCADDPDLEHLFIDRTVISAHPCAAGALKKRRAIELTP